MTFHRSGAATGCNRDTASLDFLARLFALLLAVTAVTQVGCNADGFELPVSGTRGDANADDGDGGNDVIDADPGDDTDAGPDATPPTDACPVSIEVCDGEDNDCDGTIDDGFNLMEDPANCGECGNRCQLPHTAGSCDLGECVYECLPGFYNYDGDMDGDNDNDMDAADQLGCEYQCIETNGGVEICDEADNDCDGDEDEGFNLDSDEQNCGNCGVPCQVLNATPECQSGECGYTDCDDGFADFSDLIPGCEYTCPENPPLAEEQCDGEDDNCNGQVDEQPITGFGDPCPGGTNVGECNRGTTGCFFGTSVCENRVNPQTEICDGLNNDCDGATDEGFLVSDENNCGTCGNVCDDIPNAVEQCVAGDCEIFACDAGWIDSDGDGDPAEGCNLFCTPSGPEVCDGVDNDCDGAIDDNLTPPAGLCKTAGQCTGAAATCSLGPVGCGDASVKKWRCRYDLLAGDVETDSCGVVVLQEGDCDSKDNDCDTRTDEGQVLKGAACNDEDEGQCLDVGTYVCASDPGDVSEATGLTCNAVDTDNGVGVAETCNNLDDDCDADVDEDAPDDVVLISNGAPAPADFYIQAYEASRPDATPTSAGGATHRTCSLPGAMPWGLVSREEAQLACEATGKDLCSVTQWELACNRVIDEAYPYDDTDNSTANYEPNTCNGRDFDTDTNTAGNQDDVIPTGELDQCTADWAAAGDVFDLSGNLKEWTGTQVGATGAYRVRGGSYDNIQQSLTCDFSFLSFDEELELPNLGFRCCSATP